MCKCPAPLRPHPGLGHLGARPADVQAHQSSLETAFPEAFSLVSLGTTVHVGVWRDRVEHGGSWVFPGVGPALAPDLHARALCGAWGAMLTRAPVGQGWAPDGR